MVKRLRVQAGRCTQTDTWGAYRRFLWRTQRTKSLWATNQRQEMGEKSKTSVQLWKYILKLWWEDRCTHNPLRGSSHGSFFTSFYLNRKCSVPTPRSQTELLIMWTHTWCAFITLCRCPTIALTITHPHLCHSSEQSHESSTLYFIFKHCRHISRSRQFYRSLNN